MSNYTNKNDLDEVLSALTMPNKSNEPIIVEAVKLIDASDPNAVGDLLIKTLMDAIEKNNRMLENTMELFEQGGQADHALAHASIARNNADLAKTLTNLLIEKQKLALNDKLKTRELDIKEKGLIVGGDGASAGNLTQNNYYIKSNREDMISILFGEGEEKEKAVKKIKENNTIDV